MWRQRCTVAYLDEPPYFMSLAGAAPTGCDIELTGMVLGALGVRRVDFVLTTFGELIDGVTARRWHINAPMFITAASVCAAPVDSASRCGRRPISPHSRSD
jgi:hypothetical protein